MASSSLLRSAYAIILMVLMLTTYIVTGLEAVAAPAPSYTGERYPYGGVASMLVAGKPLPEPEVLQSLGSEALALGPLQEEAKGPVPVEGFGPTVIVSVDQALPYENEPSIAVNPASPENAVLAAHHYGAGRFFVQVGVYYTIDGGQTWEGPLMMPPARPDDFAHSDPAMAASPSGAFYLAYMSLGPKEIDGYVLWLSSDIVVARSDDGGKSWNYTIAVSPDYIDVNALAAQGFYVFQILLDKEYVAAGISPETGKDLVVVSYSEFIEGYDSNTGRRVTYVTIMAAVSHDGGQTWEGPFQVSKRIDVYGGAKPVVVQGSNPAVAPDGTIYVAYYYSGDDGWLEGSAAILVHKSIDGGRTWEGPFVAAILPGEMQYEAPLSGFRLWPSMFPSMDVAPDGTIYIAYAADPDGPGGDPGDVYIVYSRDGGESWSEPVRVNDDEPGNLQFFPWLDVDSDGVAHIIWGDTRLDPEGIAYDIYYATFTPETGVSKNLRVSDYTSNPLFSFNFIGDYFNVAAEDGKVYAAWTDNRGGIRKAGGFVWRGIDQSIAVAVSGSRPEPEIAVTGMLNARSSSMISIEALNMPAYAVFSVMIDGVPVTAGFSPYPVFSDRQGRLTASLVTPPLPPGTHEIALANYTTGEIVASVKVEITDDIAELVNSGVGLLTSEIQTIRDEVAGVYDAIETVRSSVEETAAAVAEASRVLSDLRTEVEGVRIGVEDLRRGQEGIARSIDEVAKSQEEIMTRLDKIDSDVKTLEDTLASLRDRLAVLEETAKTASLEAGAASSRATMAVAAGVAAFLAAAVAAFLAFRRE